MEHSVEAYLKRQLSVVLKYILKTEREEMAPDAIALAEEILEKRRPIEEKFKYLSTLI